MGYLWTKVFHLLFMMSWMAGIFYLPRIFVHFVEGKEAGQQVDRLAIMANKLWKFMTIMMVLTLVTGGALWLVYGFSGGWLHAKLSLVFLLIIYHFWTYKKTKQMQTGHLDRSGVYYRWVNEIPLFLALGILILVVLKPF